MGQGSLEQTIIAQTLICLTAPYEQTDPGATKDWRFSALVKHGLQLPLTSNRVLGPPIFRMYLCKIALAPHLAELGHEDINPKHRRLCPSFAEKPMFGSTEEDHLCYIQHHHLQHLEGKK